MQARLPDVVAGRLCAGTHGNKSLGRGETRRGGYRIFRLLRGRDGQSRAPVVEEGSRCEADLVGKCRRNAMQSKPLFPGHIQMLGVTMMVVVQCLYSAELCALECVKPQAEHRSTLCLAHARGLTASH